MTGKRFILLLVVLSIAVVAIVPFIGMRAIPLKALFSPTGGSVEAEILWGIRLPRVCMSFLVGASLALAGMVFQGVFRNSLAEPFTLGISSGAAFGAALYVQLGMPLSLLGIPGASVFAFFGAIASIAAVYGLAGLSKRVTTTTPLLAGVAISFFFSSATLLIQYMSGIVDAHRILRWLMGSVAAAGFSTVVDVVPFVLVGSAIVIFLTPELNLLTTGDELAASRGVNVKNTTWILLGSTSLMVAGAVALCGPIGFVGLMAPHMCRLIVGPNHRTLAPATFLFGGILLTICDTISRMLVAPIEIPVSVVTSFLGGPFFLWLLLGKAGDGAFHESM
jgi:iron complex transport system permease protein